MTASNIGAGAPRAQDRATVVAISICLIFGSTLPFEQVRALLRDEFDDQRRELVNEIHVHE